VIRACDDISAFSIPFTLFSTHSMCGKRKCIFFLLFVNHVVLFCLNTPENVVRDLNSVYILDSVTFPRLPKDKH
jgi:hypothetical protein